MIFEVHVWVPEKKKRARHTGFMFELLVDAESISLAEQRALSLHPGGQLRKSCRAWFTGGVLEINSWKTED